MEYIDIGWNATDPVFRGIYRSKQRHADDFEQVLQRAREVGCRWMLITAGSLEEAEEAMALCDRYPGLVFTAGIHPTRCHGLGDDTMQRLERIVQSGLERGTLAAIGECGLDYDRLQFCDRETQLDWFERQLTLAVRYEVPLFLHSRAAGEDTQRLLDRYRDRLARRGVVHSFTGTMEEMRALTEGGWWIGVNGCSLKTEDGLAVVRGIPLQHLLVETDAPWCEMRPTHASWRYLAGAFEDEDEDTGTGKGKGEVESKGKGKAKAKARGKQKKKVDRFEMGCMVTSRNEPCTIEQVVHVVAGVRGCLVSDLAPALYSNAVSFLSSCVTV